MKFVFTYHGGSGMPETEAEQAQMMEAWGAWMGAVGASTVDGGNRFSENCTVHPDGSVTNDGGANPCTGYGIFNADDMAGAIEIAKGCPVLTGGATVQVSAAMDM
jgi:hypothetical protein